MSRPRIDTIRQRFGLGAAPLRISEDGPPTPRPLPTVITLPGGHQAMTVTVSGLATAIEHHTEHDRNEIILVLYDIPTLSFVPCYRLTATEARAVGTSLTHLAERLEADAMAQAEAAIGRAAGGKRSTARKHRRPSHGGYPDA
jgi:hypothetical protein